MVCLLHFFHFIFFCLKLTKMDGSNSYTDHNKKKIICKVNWDITRKILLPASGKYPCAMLDTFVYSFR